MNDTPLNTKEFPWMQTFTGQAVCLVSPDPKTIRLLDIAVQSSRLPRFNGATLNSWSVASHSALVEQLMPADVPETWRLKAILHDAHEYLIGDICTPVQEAVALMAGRGDPVEHIKSRLQLVIEQAAGLIEFNMDWNVRPQCKDAIKQADRLALAIEARHLLAPCEREWQSTLPDVSKKAYSPQEPARSKDVVASFIFRCRRLLDQAKITPMETFMEGCDNEKNYQ